MRCPIFFALLIYISKCRPSKEGITVETPRGRIVGFHESYQPSDLSRRTSSGHVFLGIPYAHPPIQQRRFKRPQSLPRYERTPLNATKLRPACPQSKYHVEISEDCLYLNVMTPSSSSTQLYPVMVYIHGGSLDSGSARDMDHEGIIRNLVRHGVIVVTIQYRLGALGFFNTRSESFPSNLGLLDQVEALRWIQSDIVHFGGDPNRVTLFGNSAGAASISAHTYSPLSKGLFHSVILQSGSIFTCLDGALGSTDPSPVFAERVCNFTSSDWEQGNFTELHYCLDSMDVTKIIEFDRLRLNGWKMVQDPYFLPSTPHKLAPFRQNIPVLIGSMRDEFLMFLLLVEKSGMVPSGVDLLTAVAPQLIPDRTQLQSLMPLIKSTYGSPAGNDTSATKIASDVITAGAFVAPMQRDIREWINNGNNRVFIYEMTHPSHIIGHEAIGNWNPAVHEGELPYICASSHYWDKATDNNWTTPYDFQLMEWMGEAWTNFASTGVPDLSWTPVSPLSNRLPYLEISTSGRRMKHDYRSSDELFWNEKVPEIVGDMPKEKTAGA